MAHDSQVGIRKTPDRVEDKKLFDQHQKKTEEIKSQIKAILNSCKRSGNIQEAMAKLEMLADSAHGESKDIKNMVKQVMDKLQDAYDKLTMSGVDPKKALEEAIRTGEAAMAGGGAASGVSQVWNNQNDQDDYHKKDKANQIHGSISVTT